MHRSLRIRFLLAATVVFLLLPPKAAMEAAQGRQIEAAVSRSGEGAFPGWGPDLSDLAAARYVDIRISVVALRHFLAGQSIESPLSGMLVGLGGLGLMERSILLCSRRQVEALIPKFEMDAPEFRDQVQPAHKGLPWEEHLRLSRTALLDLKEDFDFDREAILIIPDYKHGGVDTSWEKPAVEDGTLALQRIDFFRGGFPMSFSHFHFLAVRKDQVKTVELWIRKDRTSRVGEFALVERVEICPPSSR